ncbi:Peptidase family C78 [Musa troglodytarum]|uniref:Peptidase family C78 n=1 Tax=Musa troglodytarum TaxID=320322 RepID=A0A9E7GEJ0_9LILI|nr:Peptidase family C78 [Musa troglodytarum]
MQGAALPPWPTEVRRVRTEIGSHQKMLPSCPFCHISLPSAELERHANNHFMEDELESDTELAIQIALAPPSPELMDETTNHRDLYAAHSERSPEQHDSNFNHNLPSSRKVKDHETSLLIGSQIKSTFYNVQGGLMALIRQCLELENGNTIAIVSGHVDHYQSNESEDIGWGCGWRNIQMLSSHLLVQRPDARDVMFGGSGFVPDILSLQRWLEIAWKRGFDTYGFDYFGQKIYGSKKWIGTTECATILRSFGLRARIVDFDSMTSKQPLNNGNHRSKLAGKQSHGPMDKFLQRTMNEDSQVLVDWVWKYFACEFDSRLDGSKSVLISEKTPLYLQHDGHSRTIVGIQMQKGKCASEHHYSLLVLDPAHRTAALERSLADNNGWQRLIKRGIHTLKKPQYQLCYVDPGIAHGVEMEQLKIIDSILVEL